MLSLFLADTSEISTYIMLGVIVVALVAMIVISSRRNKKRQQEAESLINAVRPGHKVKTIGGVCGIVVEVDDEEGTFVLETGSEQSGKCFMKFDKQAIYQTDAVPAKDEKGAKEEKAEVAENAEATETVEATEEATPAEATETEKTEEKTDKE
jgi:preprotein translocase YajC subunit